MPPHPTGAYWALEKRQGLQGPPGTLRGGLASTTKLLVASFPSKHGENRPSGTHLQRGVPGPPSPWCPAHSISGFAGCLSPQGWAHREHRYAKFDKRMN